MTRPRFFSTPDKVGHGLRRIKTIDDMSYVIRFTPRRAGSVWSKVNIAKVEKRMAPAGLAFVAPE